MTGDKPSLAWKVRPSDDGGRRRTVIMAIAVIAGAVGLLLFHSPAVGIIAVAAILASTAEYWLGTSFALSESSATSRCGLSVTAIEWTDVKRIVDNDKTILLSPLESESRLSEFRGVLLRIGDENGADIRQFIKDRCGDHA